MRIVIASVVILFPRLQERSDIVKQLAEKLRSDDIVEREEAGRRLKELGDAAMPELRRLCADGDAEVAGRARQLLRDLTKVEEAIQTSLRWLARVQLEDGGWKGGHDDYDPAVTGLAVLAFLAAGITPASKERTGDVCLGDTVRKGLQYLLKKQGPEGVLVSRGASKYILTHAVATLALCEAIRFGDERCKIAARKAVDFLLAARNPDKAWRYSLRCGDNDTNVTLWAVLALKAAEAGGLDVPRSAFDGAKAWLVEVCDEEGRAGYTHKGVGRIVLSRGPHDHPESRTAMGLLGWSLLDPKKANPKAAEHLHAALPRWSMDNVDFYYWFLGSLALFWHEGASGIRFGLWRSRLRDVLLSHVEPDKSWEHLEPNFGEGGAAFAVAMHALELEVPSNHVTVLKGAPR